MTLSYTDDWLTIYGGDCRTVLSELPDESVHCVVTSPPYWGLRDYGHGDQLGLEPTPEQYVENMVAVFREVRRVLRSDGTVWLNLGDSYANNGAGNTRGPGAGGGTARGEQIFAGAIGGRDLPPGLKPKDLVGIPWRVAFALQADGWYLRSDIIWSKPNPMPESVTDRPTKSHEYLFLLAKSPRYFFDADAVREAHVRTWDGTNGGSLTTSPDNAQFNERRGAYPLPNPAGRNIRTVWTVATQPYPGAHFAVFPEKLIEPCILAGTSERGVCPECGKPWRRVTETSPLRGERDDSTRDADKRDARRGMAAIPEKGWETVTRTLSWIPSCGHTTSLAERLERIGADKEAIEHARRVSEPYPLEPVGAVVLDPFGGSGTTARVANRLSRRAVLIDLNPEYLKQQMDRNRDLPLGLGA